MNKKDKKTRDELTIKHFIEELSWVLSTYDHIDFKALPDIFLNARASSIEKTSDISNYISDNPNIHFLVGALPGILDDPKMFPSNEGIAHFSKEILGVPVPRWKKLSKYEIIGHIVCKVYKLSDTGLDKLVKALSRLVSGDKKAENIIKKSKADKVDWNEIIQYLSEEK